MRRGQPSVDRPRSAGPRRSRRLLRGASRRSRLRCGRWSIGPRTSRAPARRRIARARASGMRRAHGHSPQRLKAKRVSKSSCIVGKLRLAVQRFAVTRPQIDSIDGNFRTSWADIVASASETDKRPGIDGCRGFVGARGQVPHFGRYWILKARGFHANIGDRSDRVAATCRDDRSRPSQDTT